MRLDKFLKVSRLIKRRTLAKEVCDKGRVTIDGKVAKASSEVAVGQTVSIQFGQKVCTVRVNQIKETVRKDDADQLYTVMEEAQ